MTSETLFDRGPQRPHDERREVDGRDDRDYARRAWTPRSPSAKPTNEDDCAGQAPSTKVPTSLPEEEARTGSLRGERNGSRSGECLAPSRERPSEPRVKQSLVEGQVETERPPESPRLLIGWMGSSYPAQWYPGVHGGGHGEVGEQL